MCEWISALVAVSVAGREPSLESRAVRCVRRHVVGRLVRGREDRGVGLGCGGYGGVAATDGGGGCYGGGCGGGVPSALRVLDRRGARLLGPPYEVLLSGTPRERGSLRDFVFSSLRSARCCCSCHRRLRRNRCPAPRQSAEACSGHVHTAVDRAASAVSVGHVIDRRLVCESLGLRDGTGRDGRRDRLRDRRHPS